MGLRDTIFGRTKQVQPKLDNLFALPGASLTLQTELDLVSSGQAGLCFKAGSGESSISTDVDIMVVKNADLNELVTRVHSANSSLVDHELGPRLLCAVFGFVPQSPPGEGDVRMVYLLKQGTWYPFAPRGANDRNNELELRVRSFLERELPMEKDLSRWMALWGLPVQ